MLALDYSTGLDKGKHLSVADLRDPYLSGRIRDIILSKFFW